MSQEVGQTELKAKTQQLLDGPLKHIRAAAIAAALLPLASVAATPASAQTACPSGGICGTLFNDNNHNGIQDNGDTPIVGATVYVSDGTDTTAVYTDQNGFYFFGAQTDGTYVVSVPVPQGTQASTRNVGSDATDSDGMPILQNGQWFSVASVDRQGIALATDFGFVTSGALNPGTGTPGYWKNHPDAWPEDIKANGITVGGDWYSWADAVKWLGKVGKDKTTTMFSSLVPAMLNVMIGNEPSCISDAIKAGNSWMADNGPVGSMVLASSPAWASGEPTHQMLDAYNNGLLCAPHRK